jgi:hypothetical protein
MANDNCLQDRRCPMCGQDERFIVSVKGTIDITDEGYGLASDLENEDEAWTMCPPSHGCGWEGKWSDLTDTAVSK